SAGAAANSISAMMAMRAMRDNGETVVIVAREHSSARHGGEATVGTVVFLSLRKLGALPLPLVRRGQGWGGRDSFAGGAIELAPHHPLPNPPPQGGRGTPRVRRGAGRDRTAEKR